MVQDKLIFDDGRKVQLKLKFIDFPFLLKRKLESLASGSGRTFEELIVFMLDNEVKSVEKINGATKIV